MKVFFLDISQSWFVKSEASESMTIRINCSQMVGETSLFIQLFRDMLSATAPFHIVLDALVFTDFSITIVSLLQLELACFLRNNYTFSLVSRVKQWNAGEAPSSLPFCFLSCQECAS